MELVAFGCSSTHMDGVVDCLSPVSGVSGLGRHIGKEGKKKHCDKKKKKKKTLLVADRMTALSTSFPLSAPNFSTSIAALGPDGTQDISSCSYPLLTTVPVNYSERGSQKPKQSVILTTPSYLPTADFNPHLATRRVQRVNGTALHSGS